MQSDASKKGCQTDQVAPIAEILLQQPNAAAAAATDAAAAAAVVIYRSLPQPAAVSAATINTYQAATNALANTPAPPPFPQIAAGVAIASGLMNVKKILSTKTPGPSGGGGGGGSVPTAPSVPTFDPTLALAGAAGGQEQSNTLTLGEQSGSSSANVIRAYVVSDNITSQQEADKKINDLARL